MVPSPVLLEAHPVADVAVIAARLPGPLSTLTTPEGVRASLADAAAPHGLDDTTKAAVRDLLRVSGFKPSGRNKPASEYLVGARAKGRLGAINAVVDVLNAVSLEAGLPLSVVDAARVAGSLRVAAADPGASFVFNRSGQVLALSGLLCLFDAEGPCANAVKDSQRTKTSDDTTAVLVVVWGTQALPGRTAQAAARMRALLETLGAEVVPVEVVPS